METVFEKKLQSVFATSSASSNIGISVAFFSLIASAVFVGIGYWTKAEWALTGFLICGIPALLSMGFAFLAQSVTQIARLAAKAMGMISGRKIFLPEEETPQYARIVAKPFQMAVARFKERQLSGNFANTASCFSRAKSVVLRSRSSARARRRASRSHASKASKGSSNGGSSDESGCSDSGDDPHPLTNLEAKPLSCTKKTPANPVQEQVPLKPSVPNHTCPVGMCPA